VKQKKYMKTNRPHREEDSAARKAQKASVLALLRAIFSPECPATGLAQDTYLMHDIGELAVDPRPPPPRIMVVTDYSYAMFDTLERKWTDNASISMAPDSFLESIFTVNGLVFRAMQSGTDHKIEQIVVDNCDQMTVSWHWDRREKFAGLADGRFVSVAGCEGRVCRVGIDHATTGQGGWLVPQTDPCGPNTVDAVVASERAVYVLSDAHFHGDHMPFVAVDIASGAMKDLSPRYQPTGGSAAVIVGEKIWFLGGARLGVRVRTIVAYDITHDTWGVCSGELVRPRCGASAVAIAGNIWIVGGTMDQGCAGLKFADTIEMFDPVSGKCGEVTGVPEQLSGMCYAAAASH